MTEAVLQSRPAGAGRLGRRIAAAAALIAAGIVAVLTLASARTAESVALEVFKRDGAQIAALAAAPLGGAVKFAKTDILAERLDQLAEASEGDLAAAEVRSASGEVLAKVGETAEAARPLTRAALEGEAADSADGLTLARPITFGADATPVGALTLTWSDAAITGAVMSRITTLIVVGLVIALAVGAGALLLMHRAITLPLAGLQQALARLLAGEEVAIPGADRRDDVGVLARAFGQIHEAGLKAARIRRGLDASGTLLMLSDADNCIVYVSPALQALLHRTQGEIRRSLPRFDAEALVGASVDVFHADPSANARTLSSLTGSRKLQISLGGRRFDLMVNPIVGADGARLGSVAEWIDRTGELSVLEQLDEAAGAAAEGDFDRRIDAKEASPDLARAAHGVNGILDRIDAFLTDVEAPVKAMAQGDLGRRCGGGWSGRFAEFAGAVDETVGRVEEIAREIRATETAMRDRINELAEGAGDLSARTEAQASAIEETSATVEEISATITANAESAGQARGLASDARDKAAEGSAVVEDAVASMKEIEESSSRITDIISVIDSIAFQTNLLALNAAVEAARAGDAGKGFAVVASEVRTLAQRSSAAARDINELIAASAGKVADGVRHVHATGEALGGLETSVKRMSETVEDIAQASVEQATGMQEITSAVSHMDEATQRNAALAEESSRAAGALRENAEAMSRLIGFFKVRERRREDRAPTGPARAA